jgi:hypothetical protein
MVEIESEKSPTQSVGGHRSVGKNVVLTAQSNGKGDEYPPALIESHSKFNTKFRKNLVQKINSLGNTAHEEIFRKLNNDGVKYTQNSNGLFINLSAVPDGTIEDISTFVEYCIDNDKDLEEYAKKLNECKFNNIGFSTGGTPPQPHQGHSSNTQHANAGLSSSSETEEIDEAENEENKENDEHKTFNRSTDGKTTKKKLHHLCSSRTKKGEHEQEEQLELGPYAADSRSIPPINNYPILSVSDSLHFDGPSETKHLRDLRNISRDDVCDESLIPSNSSSDMITTQENNNLLTRSPPTTVYNTSNCGVTRTTGGRGAGAGGGRRGGRRGTTTTTSIPSSSVIREEVNDGDSNCVVGENRVVSHPIHHQKKSKLPSVFHGWEVYVLRKNDKDSEENRQKLQKLVHNLPAEIEKVSKRKQWYKFNAAERKFSKKKNVGGDKLGFENEIQNELSVEV